MIKSKLTITVDVGDGAVMTLPNPAAYIDGGLEWQLRYGNAVAVRFIAANLVSSYDYILSKNITSKEAMRRLVIMRKAYHEANTTPNKGG